MENKNPLLSLLSSRKAVITLAFIVAGIVAWLLGKITMDQLSTFITVTVPLWVASIAIEDTASKLAVGRIEAAKQTPTPENPTH